MQNAGSGVLMAVVVMFIAVDNYYEDGGSYLPRNIGLLLPRCRSLDTRELFSKRSWIEGKLAVSRSA